MDFSNYAEITTFEEKAVMVKIKRFFNNNRKLSYITIAAVVVVLSYYLSYNYSEIMPGIDKWYELLVTLSIGFIVNCIFYVFQVYMPKYEDEIRVQKTLEAKLYDLYCSLIEGMELSQLFFEGLQDNKIIPTSNSVAYKLITREDEKGLARRLSVELYISVLQRTIKSLELFTEEDLLSRCSMEYMDLIIGIRENRYFKDLIYAYKMHLPQNTTYGNLNKEYIELKHMLANLNIMFLSQREVSLKLLSDEEKAIVDCYRLGNNPLMYINLGCEGLKEHFSTE